MSVGFEVAGYFFLYSVMLQAVIVGWLAAGAFLATGSGLMLFHSGTLDPETFGSSAKIAMGVDAVLLLGLGLAWLGRGAPDADPPSGYGRHPVLLTSLGLLAALGLSVAALGSNSSSVLADRISTIVVLSNLGFFSLLILGGTLRTVLGVAGAVRRWTLVSSYRAGALTTLLVLGGLGGGVAKAKRWYAEPLAEVRADVDLQALEAASGTLDFMARVLCVAANEAIEGGVATTSAPECSALLAGGSGTSQGAPPAGLDGGAGGESGALGQCLEELLPEVSKVQKLLAPRFEVDVENAAMEALVVTCSKEPPPENLRGYLYTVARNRAIRDKRRGQRERSCAEQHRDMAVIEGLCVEPQTPEEQEAEAIRRWKWMLCSVDATTADLIEARLSGARFRAIGQRLGMTEEAARYRYNNALRKLKRESRCVSPERTRR